MSSPHGSPNWNRPSPGNSPPGSPSWSDPFGQSRRPPTAKGPRTTEEAMAAYQCAREQAKSDGAVSVVPFSQLVSHCGGLVAIWLRKRQQPLKVFFEPARCQWFQKQRVDSFHLTDEAEKKSLKLMEVEKKADENLSPAELSVKSHEQLCQYVCNRKYPGATRPEKVLYRKLIDLKSLTIHAVGKTLANLCTATPIFGAIMTVVGESSPHAIGLYFDNTANQYFYFDPNLGEVCFLNREPLCNWFTGNWQKTFLFNPVIDLTIFVPST